jgi:hypothetical protein
MATTYTKIASVTVGSGGAASMDFTSIPSTYTDLKLVVSARSDESGGTAQSTSYFLAINGSSSSRSWRVLGAFAGSTTYSSTGTNGKIGTIPGTAATTNTFNSTEVYFPNYAGSQNKSYSTDTATENNSSTNNDLGLFAGLYSSSSVISSFSITSGAGNFVQYSTATLYGITNASTAATKKATGGDIITTSGGYTYHAFLTSGTFTPSQALTCDYLVVAGGGSGGSWYGGGGGAGGLRSTVGATGGGGSLESALSLSSGVGYTVTIGAGGTGGAGGGSGTSGSNSVFSTITSTGGGRGGTFQNAYNADNGGSGGGGGGYSPYLSKGTGTSGQGYAGGDGFQRGSGGGGGGAGAAAANATTQYTATNGAAGVAISAFANATTTGVSTYYAGGGGGGSEENGGNGIYAGTGGIGGGGAGNRFVNGAGTSGTINTGGGGGGAGYGSGAGGNGGSGIVIVRYAV